MTNLDIDLEQGEERTLRHSASQSFVDINAKQESAEQDTVEQPRLPSQSAVFAQLPGLQKHNSVLDLPAFGGDRPYPPTPEGVKEAFAVDFDGPNDPVHPLNWPFRTK